MKVRASGFDAFESINSRYVGIVTALGLRLDPEMLPQPKGPRPLPSGNLQQGICAEAHPGAGSGGD